MAVGDVISGVLISGSTGAAARLNLRPPVGEEWVIHNLAFFTDFINSSNTIYVDLGYTNDPMDIVTNFHRISLINGQLAYDSLNGLCIHCTNSLWLQIYQNSPSGSFNMSYSGVITK